MIVYYQENENFSIEQYLMRLKPEFAQEVTDILMEDEKAVLHNWEGQNIFPKNKSETISQHVTETIVDLRWLLIGRIIEKLKQSINQEENNQEILISVTDYNGLINFFSRKFGRLRTTYS